MVRAEYSVLQLNIDIGDGRILGYDGGEIAGRYPLPVRVVYNHLRDTLVGWVHRAWVDSDDRLWVDLELANAVAQGFADGDYVWGVDTGGADFKYPMDHEVDDDRVTLVGWHLLGLTVLPRKRD